MEDNYKIRVGITHGDINGVGYEVILKTFSDPTMLELCTPIIYGSPKVAAYHRKAMDIQTNFSIVNSADDAQPDKLSIVNCTEDELKVELSKPTPEAGKAALDALERALQDYREGMIDVLVTAPINKHTIQSETFHFPGHTEYIEERVGEGQKALMILLKNDFRVALVTGHVPVREIAQDITKELIMEKLAVFHRSLKEDFGIDSPRIAVFSLNPHAGDEGLIGTEESDIIIPAMKEMVAKGIQCFGPYPADGFMGSGNYTHFDGILAMYHDQGLAPFKALAMDEGVNYTAGLPIVRTSPAHGTAYDIAGQGVALEDSFRQAIYVAMDVFRNRIVEKDIHAHPLRKQYYEKRDDSDKLKIAQDITKELIMEKLAVFHRSLKEDFGIDSPRIAVFSLNPHAGDEGLIGTEESDIIIPAMKEMVAKGIQCFGPYPADGFMGSGNYTHFDGILAMYHDQGLAPFKALAMDEGVNYTAGLPIVRTSPAHGTAYDIAGQGVALEDSFRQAIYVAMDVFRNRIVEKDIHAHPLRKQYYEKRDDSDKLKLDTIDDED